MASNTERIEQEIEQARNALAGTLDQLAERANPQKLVADAKKTALDTVTQPKVLIPAAVVGGVVALWVARKAFRLVFRR